MEAFVEHLAEALEQSPDNLSPETKLRDIPNWDSLAILTTLSMVDEQYDVTLSGPELQHCETIGDVYAKVRAASRAEEA
ncbi:MAG: acyl carrier protein [Verrucomicrobia bacterium]|jgi:acyl carrier protein|nr:acyl carrier protein [Verrucomicrobiota bacterium]